MKADSSCPSLPPMEDLRCPRCRGQLVLESALFCRSCGGSYPIAEGVPLLISPDSTKRAVIEDAHWLHHPVEGVDKPASLALALKRGYLRYFCETVLRKFNFHGRVLEIGAGSCWASSLVKRFNPECKMYSTDISLHALLKGVQVSRLLGRSMDYLAACDVHHLPFKDNLFDMVFGVASLHHLERPNDGVREIWRVLKPNGFYIGVREGLAASIVRPLYRLLGRGWLEERRFGAVERVYTYEEWMNIFSDFEVKMTLKRDAALGLTLTEKAYYAVGNLFPESMLQHMAATLMIVARKRMSSSF